MRKSQMKRLLTTPLLIVAIFFPGLQVLADTIEVRRPTYIYKEPNKRSEHVYSVSMKELSGPFVVTLKSDDKTNGYYQVRIPGKHNEYGWVYKSYVRRYKGKHPDFIPYVRKQYKHWIDEDSNCRDTRQEVLIRDSQPPVLFGDNRECFVTKGKWIDPYSGRTFTNPKQLDIDHFVPLKNAHESGAWAWSPEKKMRYANYLDDEHHLLTVLASENRKKGEKGPDRYLPPNESYLCDYVKTWVKIKEDWELEMTEEEGSAVENVLAKCQ